MFVREIPFSHSIRPAEPCVCEERRKKKSLVIGNWTDESEAEAILSVQKRVT